MQQETLTDRAERRRGAHERRHSGEWFSQTQPFHVHVYSAFLDSRHSAELQVAVIAVLDRRLQRLWCHVWYSGRTQDNEAPVVLRGYAMPIGAGLTLTADGSELLEQVVACPVRCEGRPPPVSVALAWGLSVGDVTAFHVPVELAEENASQGQRQGSLAVCVSASYGDVDSRRVVEWLEMQQLLGAQLVVIYNHSLSPTVSHVISQYAGTGGLVELRQTRAFTADDVLLHMSPVINDCMYRFHARFRYVAVIDVDELIVPRHHDTLPALLQALTTDNGGAPVALFAFRNAYFFLDIPLQDLDDDVPLSQRLSTFLVHRRRLTASPPAYSVKSVVSSAACLAMHNHYCWTYSAGLSDWTLRLDVAPRDALLHHYKPCHLDTYLKQPGHCRSAMAATVVDNVINKYSRALTDRLYTRYLQLNLTHVSS